jgi:dUTP pyrophosphatase
MNNDLNSSLRELNKLSEKIQSYISENDKDIDFDSILSDYGLDMNELEKNFMTDSSKIELPYKKLNPNAVDPKYNYDGDSGFDLYSTEEIFIDGLGRALIPTGLSFDIKDGYEIQVRSKSGLAINQGLMCLNSPGTVDSSYTGEVKVILFNTNKEPITIKKGMKIAQAVLCPVVNGKWVNPIESDNKFDKDRGDRGFGSTGI